MWLFSGRFQKIERLKMIKSGEALAANRFVMNRPRATVKRLERMIEEPI
jgi:hypothetical protein